jgi:D-glycero-D-manno-heptose 1,7-bisphosphate phosphatase
MIECCMKAPILKSYNTLFLDRDGIINIHLKNDYVKNWEEFEFLPGVLEAFALLSQEFQKILIVTNQRGVGKGLMTENNLKCIHQKMISEIEKYGGRIDKIYYCTDVNSENINRKPNSGMAFQAKKDFPDIEFTRSVMVGDSLSDLEFGKRLGMKTILINKISPIHSLLEFAIKFDKI